MDEQEDLVSTAKVHAERVEGILSVWSAPSACPPPVGPTSNTSNSSTYGFAFVR
jgi:hypothetical protein